MHLLATFVGKITKFEKKTLITFLCLTALHVSENLPTLPDNFSRKWAFWLHLCGDVEQNPGPRTEHLRFCHWNCNSIPAHNYNRIPLMQTYMSQHDLHLAAFTETALKPEISNTNIDIPGYIPIRFDLTGNDTHGGVIVYHKQDLPVKIRSDLPTPSYTIVLELFINNKSIFFIVSYRKFGQTPEEAGNFVKLYDDLLEKIDDLNNFTTILVGDYNAHHSSWYDKDKTDNYGVSFKEIFDNHDLTQMVKQPTYFNPGNPNSRTLVDLFVTNQPSLVIANEVHPSLHDTCHHQINFAKMNLNAPFPRPSKRLIWHYSRADECAIFRACQQFNWRQALDPLPADDAVEFFDQTILNIAKNFIPCEQKVFHPKDPPWITTSCKNLYSIYKRKFKRFVRRGCPQAEKPYFDDLKKEYSGLVLAEKEKYLKSLGDAVSDPKTGQRKYWTALKVLINKNKATIIPPILFEGSFVCDFKKKCSIFNNYFKNQCTLVPTSSVLPTLDITTNLRLNRVKFSKVDISLHIRKLRPNKAHGHDGITARILKMCDSSISEPLLIIFKKCLTERYFPNKWKKGNVVPIHKKNEKNLINNYRPVSLLPICGNIFEKVIFDNLYPYVFNNKFIDDRQSGYRRGDSTIKQLLSITHEIYKAFDDGNEMRAFFWT